VAVLSIAGPVVLLTIQLSLSFIVPVRQDAATFTTTRDKSGAGKRERERERDVETRENGDLERM